MSSIAEADRLYEEEKWTEAVSAYKNCIAAGLVLTNEQKSNAFFGLGYAHHTGLKQPDAALEWYSKLIDLKIKDCKTAAALNNRGNILRNRKELATAIIIDPLHWKRILWN